MEPPIAKTRHIIFSEEYIGKLPGSFRPTSTEPYIHGSSNFRALLP